MRLFCRQNSSKIISFTLTNNRENVKTLLKIPTLLAKHGQHLFSGNTGNVGCMAKHSHIVMRNKIDEQDV